MLVRHCLMIMLVIIAVIAMSVDMCVSVSMLVGMNRIAVAVLVGMSVGMLVSMLQFDGVLDHKISADEHHSQGNVKSHRRSFAQNQHSERYTKEGGD